MNEEIVPSRPHSYTHSGNITFVVSPLDTLSYPIIQRYHPVVKNKIEGACMPSHQTRLVASFTHYHLVLLSFIAGFSFSK